MKEVIKKLVEIESKATRIIDNANIEKVNVQREKKAELTKLEEKTSSIINEKLNKKRSQLIKEMEPEIDSVYKEGNEHLNKIETAFYKNREQMIEEVFDKVLK